jgi:YggT family protein
VTEAVLLSFINMFVLVFNLLLLGRVLMSYINPNPSGGIGGLLVDLTEPVLAPIRRVVPPVAMMDLSPIIAFVLLRLLSALANQVLTG